MKGIWFKKAGCLFIPERIGEIVMMILATIYLLTVYVAIIRLYLAHSFLVEVDCKETLIIFLI